jgi:tetratricopeptide (TPR) repeat protein
VLLAEDLRAIGQGALTREERVQAFGRLQVPQSVALTDATVIRVGQLVGAARVIVGSLRLEGDTMRLCARSITLDTARVDATASEEGPLGDLFAIVERLAAAVTVSGGRAVRLDRSYPPVGAFELYIKGLLAETPVYAVNYLTNAIKQAPDFDRARLALWEVYNDLGDYEHALEAITPIADSSTWARRARFGAGLSQLGLGRYDAAFATFAVLADEQPTASALNNLGVIQLRRASAPELGTAASYFVRAAAADPDDPDYRFNAGYAYWRDRDWASAVHWLREAVRRNPADADAHFVLSAALAASGNAAEAARERELAGRLSAEYEHQQPQDGVVPDGLERVRGAVELPKELRIETTLESADAREQLELAAQYLQRGRGLFDQERDREAADALNHVLFLSPYDAEAHLLLGRIHLRNGRPRDAVDALKISLWSRETAEGHAALAAAYLDAKEPESAADEARKALAIDPTLGEARRILGEATQP